METKIIKVNQHYEIYIGKKFIGSADTKAEAEKDLKDYEDQKVYEALCLINNLVGQQ